MKKIWDESKEKKQLVYNYNSEYLDVIIKKYLPKIIKQKDTGMLFMYDEAKKCYVEIMDDGIKNDYTRMIQENMFNDDNNLLSLKQIAEVKEYVKHTYNFPIKNFESCHLYNCVNGVLNMVTGELKPHSSDYLFNYCSDIEYNKDAKSNKLETFVKSVITEDEPMSLLGKIIAHIHFQGDKLQKGFLFYGTQAGRNGKGTLFKLINAIIGKQRTVTIRAELLEESSFSSYELKDKALFNVDDYKKDYLGSKLLGLLNSLISQAPDTVHQKNKPAINIQHSATPIIQCNKIPKVKADDDGGFYKRWVIVNFKNEFGDKMNEFLGTYLLNDADVMSSLLNLLIDGYRKLLFRKENNIIGNFFKADEISHIEEWQRENNSALQFIHDCCEINSMYSCSTRELYLMYRDEWNLGGSKLSETKFIKGVKDKYKLETIRKTIKSEKLSIITGIRCNINTTFNTYQNLGIVNK